jgi:hypothetical protein
MKRILLGFFVASMAICSAIAVAQDDAPKQTLFTNVNVFDGSADELAMNTDVLVEGNIIIEVGQGLSADAFDATRPLITGDGSEQHLGRPRHSRHEDG